jgi:VIT1/CCC1 family predicted Fe2+/Mn2+ transporter
MRGDRAKQPVHTGLIKFKSFNLEHTTKNQRRQRPAPKDPSDVSPRRPGFVRDIIIGMSDGLTVPFALSAGLSSIFVSSGHILAAGLLQLLAGAVTLGLGGYYAERTEMEHYQPESVDSEGTGADTERNETQHFFSNLGLSKEIQQQAMDEVSKDKKTWSDFVRKFDLEFSHPDGKRAIKSACNIGVFYILGGLIPLSPYIFFNAVITGLKISVLITLTALFIFGYLKGAISRNNPWPVAFRMMITGALAAGCAFCIAGIIR